MNRFNKLKVSQFKRMTKKMVFSQIRCASTVDDYNSLIDGSLQSYRISGVESALREMRENKIEPNNFTRSLLIEYNNQINDVKDAFEQFQLLRKSNVAISDATYTSLLRNFSRNDGAQYVDKVFPTIKTPNFKQYELAIKAYANASNFDAANKLFQQMKKDQVHITPSVYASMMRLTSGKKDLNQTVALWEELKQRNINPNLHHFDSLFYLYDTLGDQNGIEKTLQEVVYYDISPEGVQEENSYSLSLVRRLQSGGDSKSKKTQKKK